MARKRRNAESEDKWADEAPDKKTKDSFDEEIIKGYLAEFKKTQWSREGRPMPDYVIWGALIQMLRIAGTNKDRYLKGRDKYYKMPMSLFDGQLERKDPPLDPVFRYIAACDIKVNFFPRGRVMVNRAVAKALNYIRRHTDGYTGNPLTPSEVERLRFLRRWKYECWEREHRFTPGFSTETIRDIYSSDFHDLMDVIKPIESPDRFLEGLNRLYDDWNVAMDELLRNLSYDWLR
jgi:hypothetical protein